MMMMMMKKLMMTPLGKYAQFILYGKNRVSGLKGFRKEVDEKREGSGQEREKGNT